MNFVRALNELREALDADDPIDANDLQLAEMAKLCADELQRRLPQYALRNGDLPESAAADVEDRSDLHDRAIALFVAIRR